MVFRVIEAFVDALHGIDQKHWRMDYVGISLITRGILTLAAFIVLCQLLDLLLAIIGMVVVTAVVGLVYDYRKSKSLAMFSSWSVSQIFALLKRCFPLMIVILIITFFASYSRYSLERIHGTEALGIYSSVIAPTVLIQLAVAFMFTPLINLFSECIKESNWRRFIKIFIISCVIITGFTLIGVFAAYLLGEWGLTILYSSTIVPYVYLLPGAVVVTGLGASLWFMNIVFTTIRDIKGIFYGCAVGIAVCIGTTDILLVRYGIVGANYVMLISQGVAMLFLTVRLFLKWRKANV